MPRPPLVTSVTSFSHQLLPAANQVLKSAACQVPARQVPEPDSGAGARSPQLTRRGQVTPIQYPQYPALSLRCRHGADLAILAPAPTCVRALAASSLLLAPAPPCTFPTNLMRMGGARFFPGKFSHQETVGRWAQDFIFGFF